MCEIKASTLAERRAAIQLAEMRRAAATFDPPRDRRQTPLLDLLLNGRANGLPAVHSNGSAGAI